MKVGTTAILLVELDVDVTRVSKVIWTLKTPNATVQKEYPTDVTYADKHFGIPLTQQETTSLGVGTVKVEGQINYTDLAVTKTITAHFKMHETIATSLVTGNKPNGDTDISELRIKLVGEAIVAYTDGSGGSGGSGTSWGNITGTLSAQTDLKNALDGKANVNQIPSLTGYATENYVTNAISDKADRSEIPSLTGYATQSWVQNQGYTTSEIDDNTTGVTNTWSASKINQNLADLEDTVKGYPLNYEDEMNVVAEKVMGYLSTINNPIIIGFNTDQHLYAKTTSESQIKLTNEVTYGLRTLRDLVKKIPFNFVCLGGDTIGSGSTIKQMQEDTCYVIEQLNGINCPYVCLIGNHEGGQNNSGITLAQAIKSHIVSSVKDKVVTYADNGNYYYDDITCGVRIILINSYCRSGIYTITEVRSFVENALSTMPSEYKAILFSHHPIDTNLPQNSERTLWNNPISLQNTIIPYKDSIICCINGHTHNNLSEIVDGIRFISTTCAGRYELNDGSTRPYNSPEATAYDVFVIDVENNKIHCVRFGNGDDRELTIPIPTSGREDILNDVTWTDGYRLNSSGVLTAADGYSTTESIEISSGDVLYFEDGTLPVDTIATQAYNDDGSVGETIPGVTITNYGADYTCNKMYVSLVNNEYGNIVSYYWQGIITGKSNPTSVNSRMLGEFTFYDSGYIKSAKVDYYERWGNQVTNIRFTFPTTKKSVAHINVNKAFD